ncbi:MAG: hypothetical protein IPI49_05535 [Myxococcales bacterium]|jgi:hypothetical protein|nr:hypothetical protein [Myxococcales bacterium]HRC54752.1 hypothetical protein [Kofleriaceae bacterium]
MANAWRDKLGAFEVELRPATKMRWPRPALRPDDRIDFEAGEGDLLLCSHAPSRHFSGREPIHQSLMMELASPLSQSAAGTLALGRVVVRAGAERLAYQTTSVAGTVILLESRPDSYELDIDLLLVAPELDLGLAGAGKLSGVIRVPRR